MAYELAITRGDTKIYALHFRDGAGVDIDITGWMIFFTVKKKLEDIDDDAKIKKNITNHTDPIHGKTEIRLGPADTELLGEHFYDIQVKTSAGAIITIATSSIMFNYDVTRRVN